MRCLIVFIKKKTICLAPPPSILLVYPRFIVPANLSIDRILLHITLGGTIIVSTGRATNMLGYSAAELKFKSIFDLISPEAVSEFRDAISYIMEHRLTIEGIETRMVDKNDDLVYVIVSGVFLHSHGEPGYQLTVRDVSDRVHAEAEAKKARAEAELYLDLISHDIANLNQIGMGYLEIALDTLPLDEAGRELLERPLDVFKNTSRLIGNVNKLRVARHGEGRKIERISLASLLASLKDEFSPVPDRDIVINYHVVEDCAVMANGLIREVFLNLVGNAIKHSPLEKPLIIDVWLDRINRGDRSCCRVIVEDDGPGMSDALKLNLIKCMNGQGAVRGRGIGLVLTRTLVEDFKGKVLIEDRVPGDHSKGARFTVLLPAAPPQDR
jgi:PAS domain S-box-containing protein